MPDNRHKPPLKYIAAQAYQHKDLSKMDSEQRAFVEQLEEEGYLSPSRMGFSGVAQSPPEEDDDELPIITEVAMLVVFLLIVGVLALCIRPDPVVEQPARASHEEQLIELHARSHKAQQRDLERIENDKK